MLPAKPYHTSVTEEIRETKKIKLRHVSKQQHTAYGTGERTAYPLDLAGNEDQQKRSTAGHHYGISSLK